jgi:hypothetical protein
VARKNVNMTLEQYVSNEIKIDPNIQHTDYLTIFDARAAANTDGLPNVVRSVELYQGIGEKYAILGLTDMLSMWITLGTTAADGLNHYHVRSINDSPYQNNGREKRYHRSNLTGKTSAGTDWWQMAVCLVTNSTSESMKVNLGDPLALLSKQPTGGMVLRVEQTQEPGEWRSIPGAISRIIAEDKYYYVSMLNTPFVMDMPCELRACLSNGESFILPKGRSFIDPDDFFAMTIQWPERDNRLNLISNVGQAKKQVQHGDSFFGRL